jgi:predicted nucleic acid-binding Zn ribbon protein
MNHLQEDDEHEHDDDDAESPDVADTDAEDSIDATPCPYCRKPIYEQAQLCPHCGNYISTEHAPGRKPLWIVIGVIITLAIILLWVL